MAGYIRQDTNDQISPDSEIAAEPLDNEYDAIQAAFSAATGHRHNGQIGEGAPIEVVGPTLDVTFSSNSMSPKTTAIYDVGTTSFRFRNAYLSGTVSAASLVAPSVTITGGTITGITDLAVADGGTGASTAAEARVNLGLGTISTQNSTNVDIDGGSIDGTPIGQTTRSSGNFTTINANGDVTVSATLSASSLIVGGATVLTGPVSAPGGLTGNISSASKWQNPMPLSLSGGATGSTEFDGTGSPNIVVTVDGSLHDHAIVTTGSNGFMSAPDKVKLNGIQAGAQVNTVTSVNGKTGAIVLSNTDVGAPLKTEIENQIAPISSVMMSARNGDFANWLVCDGREVSRTTYATLFSLIGTTYGAGNGSTTFNIPDYRSRFMVGSGEGPGRWGYSLNQRGGSEQVTLAIGQIPSHQHAVNINTSENGWHTHDNGLGSGGFLAVNVGYGGTGLSTAGTSYAWTHTVPTTAGGGNHTHNVNGGTDWRGGGAAHDNLPPFVAVNYIIRVL